MSVGDEAADEAIRRRERELRCVECDGFIASKNTDEAFEASLCGCCAESLCVACRVRHVDEGR